MYVHATILFIHNKAPVCSSVSVLMFLLCFAYFLFYFGGYCPCAFMWFLCPAFFFISCLLDLPSPLSVPTCHKHVVFLPFVFVRWWFLLLCVPELHAFCVLYHSVFLVCDLLMFLVFLLVIWLLKKIKLSFLFCKKTKTIPLSAFVDPTEQSVPVRCVYEWDFKGKVLGFIGFTIWIYCMNIIKIML